MKNKSFFSEDGGYNVNDTVILGEKQWRITGLSGATATLTHYDGTGQKSTQRMLIKDLPVKDVKIDGAVQSTSPTDAPALPVPEYEAGQKLANGWEIVRRSVKDKYMVRINGSAREMAGAVIAAAERDYAAQLAEREMREAEERAMHEEAEAEALAEMAEMYGVDGELEKLVMPDDALTPQSPLPEVEGEQQEADMEVIPGQFRQIQAKQKFPYLKVGGRHPNGDFDVLLIYSDSQVSRTWDSTEIQKEYPLVVDVPPVMSDYKGFEKEHSHTPPPAPPQSVREGSLPSEAQVMSLLAKMDDVTASVQRIASIEDRLMTKLAEVTDAFDARIREIERQMDTHPTPLRKEGSTKVTVKTVTHNHKATDDDALEGMLNDGWRILTSTDFPTQSIVRLVREVSADEVGTPDEGKVVQLPGRVLVESEHITITDDTEKYAHLTPMARRMAIQGDLAIQANTRRIMGDEFYAAG